MPTRSTGALVVLVLLGAVALSAVGWLLSDSRPHRGAPAEAAVAGPKAIAVLPFTNLGPDPAEEYFGDGLTEELIGALSQVRALRVVARTSAFAFKGEQRDIREIARALNVGTVVEGSVRKVGDRVRVSAQLIDAADGFHRWAETYEREGTDLLAIQTELALRIASALEAELTPAERARLARRPTENPAAHALFLKGRYFWNQRTGTGYARAIEYFQRAIETDAGYAAAHAGLAMAYSLQGLSGLLAPDDARARMRAAALKALALDPLNPAASDALGGDLILAGRPEEALEHLRSALELDSTYWRAHVSLAALYERTGRFDEAVRASRRAVELAGGSSPVRAGLARVLARAGRTDEARRMLRELQREAARTGIYPPDVAAVQLALGDVDAALAWLERAYRQRHPALRLLTVQDPLYTGLEHEPRFRELLRGAGLRR